MPDKSIRSQLDNLAGKMKTLVDRARKKGGETVDEGETVVDRGVTEVGAFAENAVDRLAGVAIEGARRLEEEAHQVALATKEVARLATDRIADAATRIDRGVRDAASSARDKLDKLKAH